jgi:hypothetical protein
MCTFLTFELRPQREFILSSTSNSDSAFILVNFDSDPFDLYVSQRLTQTPILYMFLNFELRPPDFILLSTSNSNSDIISNFELNCCSGCGGDSSGGRGRGGGGGGRGRGRADRKTKQQQQST